MVGTIAEVEHTTTVSVYVNQYHRQNVRELPNTFEVIPATRKGVFGRIQDKELLWACLGVLWFPSDWDGDRDKLHTDSDPEWIEFIDGLADLVEEQGIETVLFYYP
jgi:gamma-glutamyl-gamma-aminobutyrate hydrolase PuuD